MNQQAFLEHCRNKEYAADSLTKFQQAVELARTELQPSTRLSGESFFDHNLQVGYILADNKASPEVVIAGLLHGLITPTAKEKIRSRFGPEVVSLIAGTEEIKLIKSKNKQLDAEALRKILLTTLKDVRIILIKLANKLDNLRTIHVLPPEEQERIAREVLEVYAPLASRLGAEKMRIQLEDAAFKTLNPRKYREIDNFLAESGEQRERDVEQALQLIEQAARQKVQILSIKGRPKHIYSIYKKILARKVKLTDLHDLLGVRVLVPEEKDCYILLGILHEQFEPIEGRLKDYIANPKPNLYRGIHTGVKLPTGKILEVQIRTPEMDELAEEGIAAHWRYKGLKSEELFEKKVAWLREVLQLQKELEGKEFLEAAKVDIFGDEIYCYTPKGDAKELPLGATVLDFAYTVHEEVGNHAAGGRVNGKFGSLQQQLQSGDVVEIITSKNQRPRRGWIKIVKSAKARQKIRKSLKEFEKLAPWHYRLIPFIGREEQGVLVESPAFPTAYCSLAKCCWPLPGEEIVGFVTKRRVISVHQPDCREALKEEERWVKVQWKESFSQKIKFYVQAEERSGLLAEVLHTIARAGFEVKEAKGKLIGPGYAESSFLVVPRSLENLKEMIRRVKKVKGVKRIYFE